MRASKRAASHFILGFRRKRAAIFWTLFYVSRPHPRLRIALQGVIIHFVSRRWLVFCFFKSQITHLRRIKLTGPTLINGVMKFRLLFLRNKIKRLNLFIWALIKSSVVFFSSKLKKICLSLKLCIGTKRYYNLKYNIDQEIKAA